MALGLMEDIGGLVTTRPSVRPDEYAATVNGVSVDRLGSSGKMLALSGVLVADAGDVEGAPTSFTVDVKLQDSADDSVFADIPASAGGPIAVVQITAANTHKVVKFSAKPLRRYLRAVATIAFVGGTTPNVALACPLVLGGFAEVPPVAP